jgi:hypothetical protein
VFAFAYLVIAYQLVGAVTRRFPGEERSALVAAVIIVSVGVFWLVAFVRIKTERVQAAERPGMFGSDDELSSTR